MDELCWGDAPSFEGAKTMSQSTADSNVADSIWQDGLVRVEPSCVTVASSADAPGAAPGLPDAAGKRGNPLFAPRCSQRFPICPCPTWKRAMDIAGSLLGLLLLWPFFLLIALFIKCVSGSPVFFGQRRYGLGGQPFTVWKFRTMEVSGAPARHLTYVANLMQNGQPLKKLDDELEIIAGCRILRRLGFDELPQLFNVLKGEMSLVGPRPDVMPPTSFLPWQRRRFDVLPGITGLWQVSGKNRTTFSTMMRLDIAYVRRRTFWLDIAILLRTVLAVLRN
jgi:lipopolysaccharide/colanic/teichoic acid biosynthesis glycosyltransferase